jgi:hypothetical protein
MHQLRDDFRLKLLGGVRLDHASAAAMRTSVRQRGLVGLIDPFGLAAAELRAVFVARLSAWPLRLGFGRSFGERPSLPLARPPQLFNHPPQLS